MNKNKKKQATPSKTRPPKTRTPLKTKSPTKTRTNSPTTLAEMLTNVFSTIAKYTDDDTAEYVSETLLANLCDDDTRMIVRGIIKGAKTSKFAAVICHRIFKIVDVIEKQERKKETTKTG